MTTTIYTTLFSLIKTYLSSLYSSRILINTISRIIFITNSSIYINTTIRTDNFTTIYINSIFRIHITTNITNMTNICIYVNSTIRTINWTIYKNTICTILKWNTWTYWNTCWCIYISININLTMYCTIFIIYWNWISCTIYV